MQQLGSQGQSGVPVARLDESSRGQFIGKTYTHLSGSILALVLVEIYLFNSGIAERIAAPMLNSWLLVLGGFMLLSWGASHVAHTVTSKPMQYAALGGFIILEALILAPILFIAQRFAPGVIESATGITLVGFAALTAIAFITRKDFSFFRSFLMWGGFGALGLIVASYLFGWHLGTWFSVGMIVFAGAAILYDTSNIIHHYPEDRYVAAALELFASVALMFWYVLQFLLSMVGDD